MFVQYIRGKNLKLPIRVGLPDVLSLRMPAINRAVPGTLYFILLILSGFPYLSPRKFHLDNRALKNKQQDERICPSTQQDKTTVIKKVLAQEWTNDQWNRRKSPGTNPCLERNLGCKRSGFANKSAGKDLTVPQVLLGELLFIWKKENTWARTRNK